MPALSTTARTAPPAMTPVPAEAGLRNTLPAPNSPRTSCGTVAPSSGTRKMFLRAWSLPLRIASGTSFGLAETDADVTRLVADDDERREREAPTAFDDLGHAVDGMMRSLSFSSSISKCGMLPRIA